MRRRAHGRLAAVLVACALAISGVIVALVIANGGHETSAPTTGLWAPLTVTRPGVPMIGGGIPVDLDPLVEPKNFSTTLAFLPGTHRYRVTVSNISSLGAINSFQWYAPMGVHIVKVVGSSAGRCTARGLTGFGGNQFPTLVLRSNILCDKLDLKPPSCTCLGDGGAVTISFVTDKDIAVGDVNPTVRAATLVFNRIRAY